MDVERIRGETPGCRHHRIHLNAAGSALPARPVLDVLLDQVRLEAELGGYEAADTVGDRLAGTYDSLARLIGARPDEIAFLESATRAWDMAFFSVPFARGDRILTTTTEYASNALAFLQAARRHGVRIEVVPDDAHGQISLEALKTELDRGGVRLVAINHVPTHDGLINPAAEVGVLTRAAGALYLLDACQSVGQLPVDVEEIGCDLLSATGRKFLRGPRGTGFLYVRRSALPRLEPTPIDLRAADLTGPKSYELRPDARRFECWERFVAGQLGLGAAADYALDLGMDPIAARIQHLAGLLRDGLAQLPQVTVRDRGLHRSGIVTFTHASLTAQELVPRLADRDLVVRASEQTFRFDEGVAPEPRVRASLHYYNTEEEVDRAVAAIAAVR
ncbi:MAG: aminotransferase class V-fold PLP-dependent enzyme [Streptosporangiaceae bacterium]